MAATYTSPPVLDRDHVRLLIGDNGTGVTQAAIASPKLQDEEIQAVLNAETATGAALKYFAAARCLEILMTRWASTGEGLSSKSVDELSHSFGIAGSSKDFLSKVVEKLRERGAYLLASSPVSLKAL